jgi:peptidoglycan hydrolase-like protein with peptidoglycan-binding domain
MQSTNQVKAAHSLPTLRVGSKGEYVSYLQSILNYYGYSIPVDGIFGAKTEAAVKQFQKSRRLLVDGIVGSKTWDALLADYQEPPC